ncbi:hypothetical protein [Mycolicibacterium sp.]|uniref:hypothetical protein n=1 Tax=Mycolicibacterium sp. TaxID=2320850 RepID=UPI003D118506
MTTPDLVAASLQAAVEICDETGGGATYDAVAARVGVDHEVALRELLPAIAEYYAFSLPGDDGIVVVRQPTAEARRFVGPGRS